MGGRAGRLDLRRLKVLGVATIVFFAAMVVAALATSRSDAAAPDKYAQALSSGALGLIVIGVRLKSWSPITCAAGRACPVRS